MKMSWLRHFFCEVSDQNMNRCQRKKPVFDRKLLEQSSVLISGLFPSEPWQQQVALTQQAALIPQALQELVGDLYDEELPKLHDQLKQFWDFFIMYISNKRLQGLLKQGHLWLCCIHAAAISSSAAHGMCHHCNRLRPAAKQATRQSPPGSRFFTTQAWQLTAYRLHHFVHLGGLKPSDASYADEDIR